MKLAKNRLRTKMSGERLNSLLLCTLEKLVLDEIISNEPAEK
jgi:hypothetical protein